MEIEQILLSDIPRMGWLCSYTPLELIYAAGFLPFRVVGHSREVRHSDSYTHPNMCQFVRSCIDLAVDGEYEFLDGLVFVNSCDAMRRLYDVWKRYFPTKFIYMMDLPMGTSKLNLEYLVEEINKLKKSLEEFTNKTIDEGSLDESIKLFEESRTLYRELNCSRKAIPPGISGSEMNTKIFTYFHTDPKSWNDSIKEQLKNGKNDEMDNKGNSKPRVILSGSPIHGVEFVKFVEECGLDVVYEDLCTGSKFFDIEVSRTGDAIRDLSHAYLNRAPCARMMNIKERVNNLAKRTEEYNVDGIIHHTLKFCDVYLYDVPKLKDYIVDKGIKILFIESDGRLGSFNQLKTRIEAFQEIIRS